MNGLRLMIRIENCSRKLWMVKSTDNLMATEYPIKLILLQYRKFVVVDMIDFGSHSYGQIRVHTEQHWTRLALFFITRTRNTFPYWIFFPAKKSRITWHGTTLKINWSECLFYYWLSHVSSDFPTETLRQVKVLQSKLICSLSSFRLRSSSIVEILCHPNVNVVKSRLCIAISSTYFFMCISI